MNIYDLKKLPPDDLETLLTGESISKEEMAYMLPLSDEELAIKKDELANSAILKAVLEEEFRQVKEAHKEKMKPIKEQTIEAIKAIKSKAIEVKGEVYKLPDFENQMIHLVDPKGNVISSRKMLPEERQFRISSVSKAV